MIGAINLCNSIMASPQRAHMWSVHFVRRIDVPICGKVFNVNGTVRGEGYSINNNFGSVSMGYVGLTIDTDSHVVREVVSSVSAVTVMS